MDHSHHTHHSHASAPGPGTASLNKTAFRATLHCLSGCAVGEVLGMALGVALGLAAVQTVVLSVALAFIFGYAFTFTPLARSGMDPKAAARLALGADTASITIMEIVDNAIMVAWPGAMEASLASPLFWTALASSLIIAGVAAYPLNRYLISRGKGHALVHTHHAH